MTFIVPIFYFQINSEFLSAQKLVKLSFFVNIAELVSTTICTDVCRKSMILPSGLFLLPAGRPSPSIPSSSSSSSSELSSESETLHEPSQEKSGFSPM